MRDSRLLICAIVSIVGHLALAEGLGRLPRRAEVSKRIISLRVVSPPPPLEPPAEPAATPQPSAPKPVVAHVRTHMKAPTIPVAREVPPQDTPPPERPDPIASGAPGPTFGVTMESTSQAGTGPAMAIGRPGGAPGPGSDNDGPGHGGSKGPPVVPVYEVTTMPLPQGQCEGKYTPEALRAAIEGTVILDVIVSETGRVRDVHVVSGLPHGLTEAAIAAVKSCRFSPGQKDGKAVPVRIPGYKIRFLMPTDE